MDVLGEIVAMPRRAQAVKALVDTGMLHPWPPDRFLNGLRAVGHWGPTPAGAYVAAAARYPDAVAIVDERGERTFGELNRRTNAIATGLESMGVRAGDGVAVLGRNHAGFVEATVALSKLGAHILYLNTGFASPQLRDVLDREGAAAVVYDAEFAEAVEEAAGDRKLVVAWHDGLTPHPSLDELAESDAADRQPPERPGRVVILTSGTTGAPKGAHREAPRSLEATAAVFSKIPLRARQTTLIAAPLFHAWGLAHLLLGAALSSTLVLQRRFDPEDTLRAMAEHDVTTLVVVPVMLQRILDLGAGAIGQYDTSSLRVVAVSGSALPGGLATRWMDAFGDNLYNLYGSTEVAWATIATPTDLRAAPGTAGKPPLGTTVRVVGEDGKPVPPGATGRIFVGNGMQFEGYTGGGSKETLDGLMSVGDLGHLDDAGRLFVEGREDDMIVSGGENVFPSEVEDVLSTHEAVADVAVVGVDDDRFGQRLKAFVVRRPGASVEGDDLRAFVKSRLARYKVPRDVEFLDDLPRNPTGKVLRRELR